SWCPLARMSMVTGSARSRASSTSEHPRRHASSLSNVVKTSRSSCSSSSAIRADASSLMAGSPVCRGAVSLGARTVAVLGDDELGELLERGFRRRLVEGDRAVLQEVDPVADVEHLGVVVHDED